MILKIDSASKFFGGVKAVNRVSFTLMPNEIAGLIGPNGAGKTTLFNCITGQTSLTEGSVEFQGRRISGRPAHRITELGISRTFQNIRIFSEMTVLENVMTGAHCRTQSGLCGAIFRTRTMRAEERTSQKNAIEYLKFCGLEGSEYSWAKNLPYGAQRRLEIARALAAEPKLILLDEPAAGMNPSETMDLMTLIRQIRDRKITVLLIEHHMRVVMNTCDRVVVLDNGEKIADGSPDEVRNDPKVITAYLGMQQAGQKR